MLDLFCVAQAVWRFRGYVPQPVTWSRVKKWIGQFTKDDRRHLIQLLQRVVYLPERSIKEILIDQNRELLKRLKAAGLSPNQIIYVQIDDAGGSSPVMLHMLRNAAHLERLGCTLLDSKDVFGISETTARLGEGAIIYVDDFIGSGTQLKDSRNFSIDYVVGNFSEFALVPSACEEGKELLEQYGIEVFSGHVHLKSERPLHNDSNQLDPVVKSRLQEICRQIEPHPDVALVFMGAAVMVVLYSSAPDNVPVLLRGSSGQAPFVGIFPRNNDLPFRQ